MVNDCGTVGFQPPDRKNRSRCITLQLKISPDRIHFLKFILEGYEGMAVLSTADARQGLVELRYPPEIEKDLTDLLAEVSPDITK